MGCVPPDPSQGLGTPLENFHCAIEGGPFRAALYRKKLAHWPDAAAAAGCDGHPAKKRSHQQAEDSRISQTRTHPKQAKPKAWP